MKVIFAMFFAILCMIWIGVSYKVGIIIGNKTRDDLQGFLVTFGMLFVPFIGFIAYVLG